MALPFGWNCLVRSRRCVLPSNNAVSSWISTEWILRRSSGANWRWAEACNNAVDYASTDVREQPISLVVTWLEDVLEMQITDHALNFEWPSEITLPDASAEHGRGLYIIHELMDEVAYFKGATENCLRLRKRIPRHATPEGALASDLENGLAPSTHPNERNRISSQVNLERYLLASRTADRAEHPAVLAAPGPPGSTRFRPVGLLP